jgi:hypothetical protein
MAANLPRELLFLIAEHCHQVRSSLVEYALVCRGWQSVFEFFIFSKMTVYSGRSDGPNAREQKGFSLEDFNRTTSGRKLQTTSMGS